MTEEEIEKPITYPDADSVVELIFNKLQIHGKKTGTVSRRKIKPNQLDWLKLLCSGAGNYACVKARQQGITTITLIYLLALARINPKIRINIVFQKDEPATEALARFVDFAEQLGYLDDRGTTAHYCTLTNGAEIYCQTASQKATGSKTSRISRGDHFAIVMLSEFAHYNDPEMTLNSLSPGLAIQGQTIIETTGVATAALLQSIMYDADNGFRKRFYSFESDPDFAIDPSGISDKDFEDLKEKIGIKSRGHAAYFWDKYKKTLNLNATLNEYPIALSHAFHYSHGRYINFDPQVIDRAAVFGFRVFRDRVKEDSYLISVDIAGGRERDASAIAVLNQDGTLCASFYSNTVLLDELIEHLETAVDLFKPKVIAIEKNFEPSFCQTAKKKFPRLSVIEHFTGKDNKEETMLLVKRAIEAGTVYGPIELAKECLSCHKSKLGVFSGKKDLIMAIGIGLFHLHRIKTTRREIQPHNPNVFHMPTFEKKRSWWN